MKVIVTGGAGKLGRAVVAELKSSGHVVTVIDPACTTEAGVIGVAGSVLDFETVKSAADGGDAIIHLAGISANGIVPDHQTFSINTAGTFNVHESARLLGVRRVITMSSEAVLGWAPHAADKAPLPDYLPIDEDHPCRARDPYGLSKIVSEKIAQSFALKCGIEAIAMRAPRFISPNELVDFHKSRGVTPQRFSLLHYVDVRDLAKACHAAITMKHSGFAAMYVGSGESLVDEPLATVFARLAPELADKAKAIPADAGAVSIEHAKKLLNWSPVYSWRTLPN
jgi:nucleoside-diphosphate-sugar epimerase